MKIVIALGNPGSQYEKTRHNAAWLLLDEILKNANWKLDKKFQALIYEEGNIVYLKPQTYMNNSGLSVRKVLDYYHLLPKTLGIFAKKDLDLSNTITVIHDDLDVDFGKYKVTSDSRSAGHNGVQSIINHLHTQKFRRIRLGVRNELRERMPADKFVLGRFSSEELEAIKKLSSSIIPEIK